MNDRPDPLESELSALRPRALSPDVRHRIAGRLANRPRPALRRRQLIALAGALSAACVALALFLWRPGAPRVEPEEIVIRPQPAPRVAVEGPMPTLLAYRQALARSPEELDVLLDQQALRAPELHPEFMRICALTRSSSTLDALLGDD